MYETCSVEQFIRRRLDATVEAKSTMASNIIGSKDLGSNRATRSGTCGRLGCKRCVIFLAASCLFFFYTFFPPHPWATFTTLLTTVASRLMFLNQPSHVVRVFWPSSLRVISVKREHSMLDGALYTFVVVVCTKSWPNLKRDGLSLSCMKELLSAFAFCLWSFSFLIRYLNVFTKTKQKKTTYFGFMFLRFLILGISNSS